MDLTKVKVGDKVESCLRGWGKVTNIGTELFEVLFEHNHVKNSYDKNNGKCFPSDLRPEIINWKPQKEKWQPQEGGYRIEATGKIDNSLIVWHSYRIEGRLYKTKEAAEYAYKSIRACQRLNAYVAEHAETYEASWEYNSRRKCTVYYDHKEKRYSYKLNSTQQTLGAVYMPEEVAKKLCKELNEGIVTL